MSEIRWCVLVCGGRWYSNHEIVHQRLSREWESFQALRREHQVSFEIIEGGATGADALAREWAEANDVPCRTFPADWRRYGRMAGPIRNAQMLDEGKPSTVFAFPGGRGTRNCVRLARERGITVVGVGAPDE